MDLGIRGRKALVNGGSAGLGKGSAKALAAEGVELYITARGEERLEATAEEIRRVAVSLEMAGGDKAMQLRIAEQYIEEFGKLAKVNNTVILPANLGDIASMVATAMTFIKKDG